MVYPSATVIFGRIYRLARIALCPTPAMRYDCLVVGSMRTRGNAVRVCCPNAAAAPATVSGEPDSKATGKPGRRIAALKLQARRPAGDTVQLQALGWRVKGQTDERDNNPRCGIHAIAHIAARNGWIARPVCGRLCGLLPHGGRAQCWTRLSSLDEFSLPLKGIPT